MLNLPPAIAAQKISLQPDTLHVIYARHHLRQDNQVSADTLIARAAAVPHGAPFRVVFESNGFPGVPRDVRELEELFSSHSDPEVANWNWRTEVGNFDERNSRSKALDALATQYYDWADEYEAAAELEKSLRGDVAKLAREHIFYPLFAAVNTVLTSRPETNFVLEIPPFISYMRGCQGYEAYDSTVESIGAGDFDNGLRGMGLMQVAYGEMVATRDRKVIREADEWTRRNPGGYQLTVRGCLHERSEALKTQDGGVKVTAERVGDLDAREADGFGTEFPPAQWENALVTRNWSSTLAIAALKDMFYLPANHLLQSLNLESRCSTVFHAMESCDRVALSQLMKNAAGRGLKTSGLGFETIRWLASKGPTSFRAPLREIQSDTSESLRLDANRRGD